MLQFVPGNILVEQLRHLLGGISTSAAPVALSARKKLQVTTCQRRFP